ncbi:MAG: hypothetical protein WC878_04235 [Candidatus Paceibacterota bacterium]|jgi:hypothetical protein
MDYHDSLTFAMVSFFFAYILPWALVALLAVFVVAVIHDLLCVYKNKRADEINAIVDRVEKELKNNKRVTKGTKKRVVSNRRVIKKKE